MCACVWGPGNTGPVWTWPYLIRENTRNAIKCDKSRNSSKFNQWLMKSFLSSRFYLRLSFCLMCLILVLTLTQTHSSFSYGHNTYMYTYGRPCRGHSGSIALGLLCYFNVCCCTWGDTQTHIWQHDRGAQLLFPGEGECVYVCVCVSQTERGEQKRRWR